MGVRAQTVERVMNVCVYGRLDTITQAVSHKDFYRPNYNRPSLLHIVVPKDVKHQHRFISRSHGNDCLQNDGKRIIKRLAYSFSLLEITATSLFYCNMK